MTTEDRANEHHVVLCYFSLTRIHSSCFFFHYFVLMESNSTPGFICSLPQRESRFRKLEACTLQVFELCHWRQHSHKVDCCPSPEVFPCQKACSAQRRWIQTLAASQTGPFVWVFGKHLHSPRQKNTTTTVPSLSNRTESSFFIINDKIVHFN